MTNCIWRLLLLSGERRPAKFTDVANLNLATLYFETIQTWVSMFLACWMIISNFCKHNRSDPQITEMTLVLCQRSRSLFPRVYPISKIWNLRNACFLLNNINLDFRVNWCHYGGQKSLKSHVLVISNIKTTIREIPLKVLRVFLLHIYHLHLNTGSKEWLKWFFSLLFLSSKTKSSAAVELCYTNAVFQQCIQGN